MSATEINRYDEVPYSDYPIRDSHPICLEAIGTLFGMRPAAVPGARVLELGCASGGNLIPQAQDFSQASYVGVDLSVKQIEAGRAAIRSLALKNIELRAASILDIDASWGKFDYILCHGVYSWVPDEVRAKILSVCREHLSPQGIAFISYNVLPGWHMRRAIREMVLYHTRQFSDVESQITQTRKLLDFLAENTTANTAWNMLLSNEVELLKTTTDSYIYHEHLEEVNTPFYFHEFASSAEGAGLQYLGDTELSTMLPTHLSLAAQQVLANLPLVRKEQYMDFIRNRTFRKTLVCQSEVRVNRTISVWDLEKFHLAFSKKPEFGEAGKDGTVHIQIGNSTLSSRDPLVLSGLRYLKDHYPNFVPFTQLFAAVVASLSPDSPPVTLEGPFSKQSLLTAFTSALFSGMIDLAVHPPRFVRQVSERPKVTPLARWQAERGDRVTNRRHELVQIDDLARYFIRRFDGRHHVVQLRQELSEKIRTGQMKLQEGDRGISNIDNDTADGIIQQVLTKLSSYALLVN